MLRRLLACHARGRCMFVITRVHIYAPYFPHGYYYYYYDYCTDLNFEYRGTRGYLKAIKRCSSNHCMHVQLKCKFYSCKLSIAAASNLKAVKRYSSNHCMYVQLSVQLNANLIAATGLKWVTHVDPLDPLSNPDVTHI